MVLVLLYLQQDQENVTVLSAFQNKILKNYYIVIFLK